MKMIEKIEWINPREKLWGFHVHQELPLEQFAQALSIQKQCAHYLNQHEIHIDNDDAIKPGYGPHLDYMWELRVENLKDHILEKMGLAIAFMAINRSKLSAYIHPLMQDKTLSDEQALTAEGLENQANALWFGYRVAQNQDFFFHPPKDQNNQIVDTRTPRILSDEEKTTIIKTGEASVPTYDPGRVIINGFHIHMDFSRQDGLLALSIFDAFLTYLDHENLKPTSTRIYEPLENGPHQLAGWEVKFETNDCSIIEKIGVAVGWLMCNRQGLSVFMHPVTWQDGNFAEELKAHEEYSFFLGYMPELDLGFFSRKIK